MGLTEPELRVSAILVDAVSGILIDLIVFLGTPAGLIWGCYLYLSESRKAKSFRLHLSLFGLCAIGASMALWLATAIVMNALGLHEFSRRVGLTIAVGAAVPLLGTVVSMFGRPRLIAPIALASIGTSLFWIGSTVP